MVRSLWTAASGMRAQQTNVDTISNNLANVNTIGYKKETVEFKSLLYQTIQAKTTSANGDTKPVGAQVGLGVKNASITSIYKQGNINQTENDTDLAIEGKGFFTLRDVNGDMVYTRNGSFIWAVSEYNEEGNIVRLVNSDGLPVLDEMGNEIAVDTTQYNVSQAIIDDTGRVICKPYPPKVENGEDEEGNQNQPVLDEEEMEPFEAQIGLVQFSNPSGLLKMGGSLYKVSEASGEPVYETDGVSQRSLVKQGFIENSNVQVVDEMVNLIVAQRAYEMNSKAITTSDEMMQQANQLKR